MANDKDRAAQVIYRRKQSSDWLQQNFYPQWTKVYQLYKCEPEIDASKEDKDRDDIVVPDIWSLVRRQVARVTAQLPNVRYRAKDLGLADRISRKIMRDWDVGGVQRQQKPHVTQAALFGWSVRGWSWDCNDVARSKRVNPLKTDPSNVDIISKQYGDQLQQYAAQGMDQMQAMAQLVVDNGRAGMLPIRYTYRAYEGPRADTIFIGDCFPSPNFKTLQTSPWFIVRRKRNKTWLENAAACYEELQAGIQDVLTKYPKGMPQNQTNSTDGYELRRNLLGAIGRVDQTAMSSLDDSGEYTLLECHYPGSDPKIDYCLDDGTWIGSIPYPYELDGRIAFTDLVLVEDLMCGIGDSHARIVRGLNTLHNRQVNLRMRLTDNLLRPLMYTLNRELYDNPELLKRHDGFRLVHTFSPNDIGIIGEQGALASAAQGMNEDGAISRMVQQATGENNMSMNADVDPSQNRTATGARLMAFNQDILTRDLNDAFTYSSLVEDVKTIYLLNRSEMPASVEFDGARYIRSYGWDKPIPEQDYMSVSPEDFQDDNGEVEVETGSTMADDDDAKVQKAMTLFQAAMGSPQLFNLETARDEFLIANGKGRELHKWAAPPQPPPPPAEPKMSLSIKMDLLPPEVQQFILAQHGLMPQGQQPPAPQDPNAPPPPDGAGGPPPPPPPPDGAGGPPPPPQSPDSPSMVNDPQQGPPMSAGDAAAGQGAY